MLFANMFFPRSRDAFYTYFFTSNEQTCECTISLEALEEKEMNFRKNIQIILGIDLLEITRMRLRRVSSNQKWYKYEKNY